MPNIILQKRVQHPMEQHNRQAGKGQGVPHGHLRDRSCGLREQGRVLQEARGSEVEGAVPAE